MPQDSAIVIPSARSGIPVDLRYWSWLHRTGPAGVRSTACGSAIWVLSYGTCL